MGELGNCEAVICVTVASVTCGLEAEINEVRPGSRDACTSHEGCETSVTLLCCSAVNGLHRASIA